MNRVKVVIILLVGLVLACTPTEPKFNLLDGQYQWLQSVGGFAGETRTPESTGDVKFLTVVEYDYIMVRNDTIVLDDRFKIELMTSPYFPDNVPTLIFENIMNQAFEFSQDGDTLFLYDNCVDCFAHSYFRIK